MNKKWWFPDRSMCAGIAATLFVVGLLWVLFPSLEIFREPGELLFFALIFFVVGFFLPEVK